MRKFKLRNILAAFLILVCVLSAVAVFTFASASDITTQKSEDFSGVALGKVSNASCLSFALRQLPRRLRIF